MVTEACKTDIDSWRKKEERTDGWSVHGHCCRVPAASRSAAAARWRGGPPPAARIRDEPHSGALRAHYHPAINKYRAETDRVPSQCSPYDQDRREQGNGQDKHNQQVTG